MTNKAVTMSCTTTKSPALPFSGPHVKPHGVQGLRKNYHINLDPKLGHGNIKCDRYLVHV